MRELEAGGDSEHLKVFRIPSGFQLPHHVLFKTIHPVTGLRPLAGIPHLLHFLQRGSRHSGHIHHARRQIPHTGGLCFKSIQRNHAGQIRSHMQHSKILYSYSHL